MLQSAEGARVGSVTAFGEPAPIPWGQGGQSCVARASGAFVCKWGQSMSLHMPQV